MSPAVHDQHCQTEACFDRTSCDVKSNSQQWHAASREGISPMRAKWSQDVATCRETWLGSITRPHSEPVTFLNWDAYRILCHM